VIWALPVAMFVIGFLAALARYMWRPDDQHVLHQMMLVSACAVVAVLTLTAPPGRRRPAGSQPDAAPPVERRAFQTRRPRARGTARRDPAPPEYSIGRLICRYWLPARRGNGWLAGCP
jgi:hypothetical protein